jgi:phosphate transport system substrate-binding protein
MVSRTSRSDPRRTAVLLLACALACALLAVGCTARSERGSGGASSGGGSQLLGAGATFPAPLYTKWLADFERGRNAGVKVVYQAVGSGAGVERFMNHEVDFGASDVAMTDDELTRAEEDGGPVLHIPTAIGAVSVAYFLPGKLPPLRMDGPLLGDIFLGRVRSWDDPAIAATNPGVTLPHLPITVVHRSDSSGTTANFTRFVANHSPDFAARVGAGKSVHWPVGVAAKGSSGVAKRIHATRGAIGYVELTYALDQNLGYAAVKNASGRFVRPTPATMAAAAAGLDLVSVINNFRVSLIDAAGPDPYPITSWTFILVRESQTDALKARTLANLLWFMTHEGQGSATSLHYAPLPGFLIDPIEAKIRLISGPDGRALSIDR